MVSTPLKNTSQNGNLPQIGVKKYVKPPPKYCFFWGEGMRDLIYLEHSTVEIRVEILPSWHHNQLDFDLHVLSNPM